MVDGALGSSKAWLKALGASVLLHCAVTALSVRQASHTPKPAPSDVWQGASIGVELLASPPPEPKAPTSTQAPPRANLAPPARPASTPPRGVRGVVPPNDAPDARNNVSRSRRAAKAAKPQIPQRTDPPATEEEDWLGLHAPPPPKPRAPRAAKPPPTPDPNEELRRKILSFRPKLRHEDPVAEAAASQPPSPPTPGPVAGSKLPPGVRRLGAAFTRAIPVAADADPAWRKLPTGSAGSVEFELELDSAGLLKPPRLPQSTPPRFRRLIDMVAQHVARARLATDEGIAGPRERFQLSIRLSQTRAETGVHSNPNRAIQLEHRPPTLRRPGKAVFRLPSGRRFQATVRIVAD